MIWYGPNSRKSLDAEKAEKNWSKYADRAELKKIPIRIY